MKLRTGNTEACVFSFRCKSPRAGSREHIMFASLGGLRVSRKILCHDCQPVLGEINKPLATDLAGIAARIGVANPHRGPIAAVVVDPVTNEEYRLVEGTKISYPAARTRSVTQSDGTTRTSAVCSTQAQRDALVHKIKAEGRDYTVSDEGRRPMRFSRPLTIQTHFGGARPFRALAHLALNFLAHEYPHEARDAALESFKRFILDGSSDDPVSFDYSWNESYGPNAYRFGHRVYVGKRADGNIVGAISLYGIYDVAVRFGAANQGPASSVVFDIDPLTTSPSTGWTVRRSDNCMFVPCVTDGESACRATTDRLRTFLRHVNDHFWERDAPDLVRRVNGVRRVAADEQQNALAHILDDQLQRILNVVADMARTYYDGAGRSGAASVYLQEFFRMAVEEDNHDLTPRSDALLMMIRDDLVDHLLVDLANANMSASRLREYLEGAELRAATNRAFVDILEILVDHLGAPSKAAATRSREP